VINTDGKPDGFARLLQALQRFHERLYIVVVAGGDEVEDSTARAENEAPFQAGAALEVVATQAANAQSGMQVRGAKAVPDCVDYARDLAPA
jgi:hypothetical protein